ncbi:MAG: hypothetical protein M1833_000395, partial [Piccolia ochrophora]
MVSLFPASVQKRLPRFPVVGEPHADDEMMPRSSRIFLWGSGGRRRKSKTPSVSSSSGIETPPPAYDPSSRDDGCVLQASGLLSLPGNDPGQLPHRERLQSDRGSAAAARSPESQTGVDWKAARQGFRLVDLALDESVATPREEIDGSSSFSRQLYVHGMSYLLRGLPQDLDSDEQTSLRTALPHSLATSPHPDSCQNRQCILQQGGQASSSPPSLLHRFLASTIVQIFVVLRFLFPYVRQLCSTAYTYDRTHHVSERLVTRGVGIAHDVGTKCAALGGAVAEMGNGK